MAASMISRLVVQTSRLTAVALRQHSFCAAPKRSFSASSCVWGSKRYTENHEWVEQRDGDKSSWYTVGISNFAQDSLGEIVYVEPPPLGASLQKEDNAGCVESVKAVGDIYSPMTGTVVEINTALETEPSLVNSSPEDKGWLFKLDVPESATSELETMMEADAYQKFREEK